MAQIPILNGIYAGGSPDLRTSHPVNLVPVPKQSGISNGFLRPADGIVAMGAGPGVDRGGISWNGACYRVMGTKLVTVASNGTVAVLGDVGGPTSSPVRFDYSFDRLAVASGGRLYYLIGSTLTQVTDADLGVAKDVIWIDGYFITTDGEFLIVTELNDPTQVNPLKYGSSEIDPDPVVALLKHRNEAYALNRHTIEVFDNVGGDFFPFRRIDGAQIQKGVVGTHACCVYIDTIAFLGSGRNEAPGIYLAASAGTQKISTQDIDELLMTYTDAQLASVELEARNDKSHQHLYIHLPDRTIVYDAAASQAMGEAVFFTLTSTMDGFEKYRARNFVWCYDKWLVGDPNGSAVGYMTQTIGHHWGQKVRWEFGTMIAYGEGRGGIFHSIELVSLTGSIAVGLDPRISTSYSHDGVTWSQDKSISAGKAGERAKRLCWHQQGRMGHWRAQRFLGDSDAHISFVRLEAQIEALAY
jgi:hypothetical protein